MLKKSLIAVAVLAIALPAMAGELKVHDWPGTYEINFTAQNLATIEVQLDVGYYIHLVDQGPIKVEQDVYQADNPSSTYVGCDARKIESNFNAKVSVSASATSAAGGNWSAVWSADLTYDAGDSADIDVTGGVPLNTNLCVKGENVNIAALTGGAKNVPVASVAVTVMPANGVIDLCTVLAGVCP